MQQSGIQHAESHRMVLARLVISHLACLGVFIVPATAALLWACALGYLWRVLAFELAAHRYFSHRAFKTSRAVQLLLALMVAASGQRGPIWWAMHHRSHHRHADGTEDVHSPVTRGFWQAHLGWLVRADTVDTDLDAVKDLSRVPELVWINRWHMMFPLALLVATALIGGWPAVIWAFFVPTVLALHAAFAVNTLTHGRRVGWFNLRPYTTRDASTNNWLLALPTLGAAWHNNHHRCMNAARAGFRWWELDLSYALLWLLARLGIVWDLQPVPQAALLESQRQQPG